MILFRKPRRWWGIGLGAGLVGALAVAVRHSLSGGERSRIPDSISPAIFATRVARTAHGQIVFHESGAGTPLIFLHGAHLGGSSYEWSKVYPSFAETRHVFAPDLIGFGESERPAELLSPFDHVRALVEFISQICTNRPCSVVASHFGGAIAVLLASQHPDLVQKLILFAPTGFSERVCLSPSSASKLAGRIPGIKSLIYKQLTTRQALKHWLNREGFRGAQETAAEVVEVFYNCARQYRADVAGVAVLAKSGLSFDFEKRLATLPLPVALLWPAQSASFPLQRAKHILSLSPPGSTLDVLPECSLLAPIEAPKIVAQAVSSALDLSIRTDC